MRSEDMFAGHGNEFDNKSQNQGTENFTREKYN